LAAVYLTLVATDEAVREDFRRRALVMAGVVFVVAAVALVLAFSRAPLVARGVIGASWSIVLHVCTAMSAIVAIVALWRRQFALARISAAAQVSFILWGWAFAQFPFVIPTTLSIREGAAPRVTLELLLVGLSIGAVVLIPSLLYLFRTFGAQRFVRSQER
jgi:cytochrome d ubiquinol oxidase subunit II